MLRYNFNIKPSLSAIHSNNSFAIEIKFFRGQWKWTELNKLWMGKCCWWVLVLKNHDVAIFIFANNYVIWMSVLCLEHLRDTALLKALNSNCKKNVGCLEFKAYLRESFCSFSFMNSRAYWTLVDLVFSRSNRLYSLNPLILLKVGWNELFCETRVDK